MTDWLYIICILILLLVIATIFNSMAIATLRKRIYSLEEFKNLLDEQFRNIQ